MRHWGKYYWTKNEGIEEPTETGAYLVTYRDEGGNLRKKIVWVFIGEGSLGTGLGGIVPETVEGPLPGSRPEEWPRISANEESMYSLLGAMVVRAMKDAAGSGTGYAARKNRESARKFLESFPLGQMALAEIDARKEIKSRKKKKGENDG